MKIEIIPEVGDTFIANKFSFFNPQGGTGLSDWEYDEKYSGPPAQVEITKVWYDDECGYRCWAKAINQELIDYLKRMAAPKDQRIFVSQWDLEIPK